MAVWFCDHSCLSVCYIFANEYIYINEFLREHDLDRTALCLCIQTVQAVVISETSCITIHYLSMDVSEPGWFNWDRDFYCFENVYL